MGKIVKLFHLREYSVFILILTMGLLQDIIESIFQPGCSDSVRNLTFIFTILLILLLGVMIFATGFNIHVIVMFSLAIGLLFSLVYFFTMQAKYKALAETEEKECEGEEIEEDFKQKSKDD